MPEVYLEVEDESQVPKSTSLRASYGGKSETIEVKERKEGNLIYRSWTANIGGGENICLYSTYQSTFSI